MEETALLIHLRRVAALAIICILAWPVEAYSVLSHEALIDALWSVNVRPLLLARFPNATPDELKRAHGFAYGGAIIQDLGYYPHGSPNFSDLTHYVRTGDFIKALVKESQTLEEYAFALGALSHYVADLDGHRYATNVAEPILYPELGKKYGKFITYEDNPAGHLKTEYSFDVLEVAKGNFAPEAYHDFIGFDVATGSLQRAFHDTYGLDLQDVFKDFDRAVGSYRHAVSKTIPMATRVAWAQKQGEIQQASPGMTKSRFIYLMSRSSYERYWGKNYDTPTTGDRILAFLLKLLPPIGPLKALKLKMPTPQVEKLFEASFDRAAGQYRGKLAQARTGNLDLPNENYDVGVVTPPGTYRLDDDVRSYWIGKLAEKKYQTVTPEIRAEILAYYSNLHAPFDTKRHPKKWRQILADVDELKQSGHPVAVVAAE